MHPPATPATCCWRCRWEPHTLQLLEEVDELLGSLVDSTVDAVFGRFPAASSAVRWVPSWVSGRQLGPTQESSVDESPQTLCTHYLPALTPCPGVRTCTPCALIPRPGVCTCTPCPRRSRAFDMRQRLCDDAKAHLLKVLEAEASAPFTLNDHYFTGACLPVASAHRPAQLTLGTWAWVLGVVCFGGQRGAGRLGKQQL